MQTRPLDYHLDLGARLAALRSQDILILGSGNVVHNLASMQWDLADTGFGWARRFDDAAREQMLHGPDGFGRLAGHSDFTAAVPTPDHFLPSVYFAGLAAAARQTADVLVDGYTYGSLSMTSYTLGASVPEPRAGEDHAPASELPRTSPADSNI